MEVVFQAEMMVVAVRGKELQDWDLLWRKGQQDLLVGWMWEEWVRERAELTFRWGPGEFW